MAQAPLTGVPLTGIKACVFDAYGTLFDFASAAARCAAIPEEKRARLTALWRDRQLQYSWLRSLQNRYVDFERVTRDAHTVDDALFSELRQHFDEGEIIELLAAIGLFNYFNRFNDALTMEPTK